MASGTFTATGNSATETGDQVDVLIHGTFVGTIELQTQVEDGTWVATDSFTSASDLLNKQSAGSRKWRLACTIFTSGTVNYSLSAIRFRDFKR